MAAKSIISVDIDPDGKFKAFYELFQKYQKQVEEMPDDWKKVTGAIEDAEDPLSIFAKHSDTSKEALAIAAAQAEIISRAIGRTVGVQEKLNVKVKDGAIQMTKMAKASQVMEKTILSMGRVLLKLGTVGVSGAGAAIGAVYGATSAVAGQNLQARGLGLRIGQTQAFVANFERFGLGTSDLGNVANAQSDVSKWRAFMAAGLTPQQIQSEDAEQLTYDFARAASGKFRQWQKSGMPAATMAQAYGFTDLMSLQQLRTGASYDDQKWIEAQNKTLIDAKNNEINQGTADQASDVKAALQSDWAKVYNEFNTQLATAAPEIQAMGDAASNAAVNLLKFVGPQVKNLLDTMQGDPVSRDDANKGSGLVPALARMGYSLRDLATVGSIKSGQESPVFHWDWKHPFGSIIHNTSPAAQAGAAAPSAGLMSMLDAQYTVESGRGKNLLSRKGAMGPLQFMPDTWKEWGHGDVNNLKDATEAAARYDTFLLKRYGGDVRKALAAYNWGMGNVDKDIAAHGDKWEQYVPKGKDGTSEYINRIIKLMAQNGKNVNINITNSTPARVAVSQNAAQY